MKNLISIFIIILFLLAITGCDHSESQLILQENENLRKKNEQLENSLLFKEDQLKELEQKMAKLNSEISDLEKVYSTTLEQDKGIIWDLEQENKALLSELENIHVFEENIFIASDVLIPDEISVGRVIQLFGAPKETEQYISDHSGLEVIKLIYENSSFVFELSKEKDLIKWLTFTDRSFITNRGIAIGSTKEKVIKEYGENYYNYYKDGDGISYGEKTGISFRLDNDVVTEIRIWFMYE